MNGPPIPRGALLIGQDGRIEAVGTNAAVPRPDGTTAEEFADGILLPGLVNTHTHLELTGLTAGAPEPDFTHWIGRVRRTKAARSPAEFLEAARLGVAECHAAGVTTVADTGDSGAVIRALAEAGGSGIAYQEVFGPHPDQLHESLEGLKARVDELSRFAAGRVRIGVSPHAPYTVSGLLYARVAAWAGSRGLPLAVHVAESPAESEFLARDAGPFSEAWRTRGIPLPAAEATPVEWLDRHGVLGPATLCIHLVQAGADDLRRVAARGAAVAHCPLSNRAHGHGAAPLREFLAHGLRVGVGTDSVMSVGILDLLAEARAARSLAGLAAADALRLCTLGAAEALGLEREIGSLEPGKWGDCVVLRPQRPEEKDPLEQALAAGPADVLATYQGGRDVYRADSAA